MSALDVVLDRPLPQNPDAERAVLGSLLINNGVAYRIDLTDEEFFKDVNRRVYAAMVYVVFELRQILDGLTLKEELARRGELEMIGGQAYISALMDAVPDVANVERYAAIVRQKAKLRALIVTGSVMMRAALEPDADEQEIAATALAEIGQQATRDKDQAKPLAEVLSDAFAAQRTLAREDKSVAIDCGFKTLNDHKVFYDTLIILSADKKMGKSALMTAFARNMAKAGHGSVIISLESTPKEISLRYASMDTGIPHRYMRDWRTFSDRNREQVQECQRVAGSLDIFLGRGPRNVESIALEIRRLRAMHGIQAAFIDYVQLVGTKRHIENREERMAYIADTLLGVATETGVSTVLLSQVNKAGDTAYAESISKSARVWLHFDRPHKDDADASRRCYVDFAIKANNEERTNSFVAHFCEVTQRWREGECADDCRTAPRRVATDQGRLTI